ncbi:MAG: SGNH/GDSL hydrolase family protein, partial [Atopobiaceae bacterium]|nr:SGNH/GDSL hydrolase family protein [Atopobiaceae bacterium]
TAGYLIDGYEGYDGGETMIYSGGEGTYYEPPADIHSWTNAFRAYASEHGVQSFVNAGVSGFRMQYLAEDPDAWLGDGASVIVVMLGTNDAAKESVEDFAVYASEGLQAAASRCEHLVVVSPPNNERNDTENLYGMDQIDAVLSEESAVHGWEHVSLLDVIAVGTDDFFPDQVHPTEQGSAKLWEAFRTRLGLA